MSGAGTGYDLSPTTYNPEGKVFQIEYAYKATENSSSIAVLHCRDGIVFGAEKLVLSKMMVEGTNRLSSAVHLHAGLLFTGVVPDGRALVTRARQEAAGYQQNYGLEIPAHVLADRVAQYMHAHTIYGGVRPFGVMCALGALDRGKPRLYMLDPSGNYCQYYACTGGKGSQTCKTEIDKLNLQAMSCEEALEPLAKMLLKVYEENRDKRYELELYWMTEATGFSFQEVPRDLRKAVEQRAKDLLETEAMGE
jgi:20S proteasome subunit alpha 7